jgi:hypothetical protein
LSVDNGSDGERRDEEKAAGPQDEEGCFHGRISGFALQREIPCPRPPLGRKEIVGGVYTPTKRPSAKSRGIKSLPQWKFPTASPPPRSPPTTARARGKVRQLSPPCPTNSRPAKMWGPSTSRRARAG